MLSYQGRNDQALSALEESLKTATDSKLTYYQRYNLYWKGQILANMKALDKAQAAAAEFKTQAEESKDKREISNYYDLFAKIELEKGNYTQAVEYVEKALPLYSYSPLTYPAGVLETQALAYFRSGNMDKAKEVFEKIQALTSGRYYFGSSYVKSYFMLGQIYEQKGDKIKAADLYRKFLELWKDADPGLTEIDEAKTKLKTLTEI
jgi:tetratricopeptide (TPR) repeat protein